jgi:zinc protease
MNRILRLGFALALTAILASCAPQPVVLEEPIPATDFEPAAAPEIPSIPGLEPALLAEPIGLDPAVRTGTLDNGLTYFVRRNTEPLNRAELRLVVNAGSVLEDDDQRGLAHLLEHMAFNGTERFPELELVNYLERIGMRFGPDLNAYTSFDETVYMLQVPTDDAELLDTGLTVLREWAGSITLREEDIDAERGVVLEEWRVGQGAGARIRDQQFPVLLADSRYAERLPIGTPEVIQNAPAERVRDFYRDWYRPELMAIVAIGDFDPAEMQATIRERFSDLRNPAGAPERPEFAVPPHDDTRIAIATDPEQQMTVIQVLRKLPRPHRETVYDMREQIVDRLYDQMMNARLREITQSAGAPFLGASAFTGGLVRPIQPAGMFAMAQEDGVPRALEALLVEARRVRLHGFTEGELTRAGAEVLRGYERAYEQRDQRPSRAFAGDMVSMYLQGGAAPAIERERELVEILLPTITLAELDERAEVIAGEDSRVILVGMPEKEGIVPPNEGELRAILQQVQAMAIEPYEDAVVGEALLTELPRAGAIAVESVYAEHGITEWMLDNGVRVVVKPTDFRNDEISVSAFRAGGTSLAEEEAYLNASQASAIAQSGGVGSFSATELERFLAGQTVRISPFVATDREGITGSFSPASLETALQLIHLYFTEPRRDDDAFEAYVSRMRAFVQNRSANPVMAFSDTLTAVLTQNHPRSQPLTLENLDGIDLDEALTFFRSRFADASGFTFVFVGAVSPESLAPLAKQYLATLPVVPGSTHESRDLGIRPPPGVVERTVYRGLEPQARVAIVFSSELAHDAASLDPSENEAGYLAETAASRWERFRLGRLSDALGIRLREELREDRGGVYGVGVNVNPNRQTGINTFSITFSTDPERVDELVDAVFAEIEQFQRQGPDRDILDRVIERGRRSEETDLRTNQFWSRVPFSACLYDEDPGSYLSQEDLRQRITPADIRRTATEHLRKDRYVRVVLLPEEMAGN